MTPPSSEPLRVAIAAENDDYDGVVYRRLVELVLGERVVPASSEQRFSGLWSVVANADPFLRSAHALGVRHALFAIDNDGGARRHPEHIDDHDPASQAADTDGCRFCRLTHHLPRWWAEQGQLQCLVVPVQTIETWLLWLRGDDLSAPSPEQFYSRPVLKRRFHGKPTPPLRQRIELALGQLQRPDALDRLRERPSFRRFEAQLATWRRR